MQAMSTSVSLSGADGVIADDKELDVAIFFACVMCLELAMMNVLCRIFGLPLRWAGLQGIRCGAISMWRFGTAFVFFLHQWESGRSQWIWTQDYSRGPFLAVMFLLVFWILFWGPWWSRFVGIRGAPRLTEACPRHAWQELLWKKPPLRTSTCGRHRFRRNYPLWEPRMWQGQVWEARPDGESTRGKAKFGKRHGSRKWEEGTPQHEGVTEGRGGNGSKPPPPPYNVPHTPLGASAGRVASITLYFSNAGNASAAIFWGFWHPQWSFARGFPHPQGNPQASARALADMWIKMAAFPDLALPRCCLAEIARACNYSSWFKFSSSQYPLETYKLRNMVRCKAILCLGAPIQCQRLQFYTRPWCQRFYREFMAPLPCENTSAAWQLFFTARTWAKPHRLDSSVTLLLRRVVQSKTQWHSNVLKLLKLLQKSSQALKTFFQLLQIKRLQLKLTNTSKLQPNTVTTSSSRIWVKQHPKTPQTTKTNENPSPSSSMHKLVPFGSIGSYLVPIGSYGSYSSQIGSYKFKMIS